ncbi:hypothetical protein V0U79_05025 [Hyphobacterium sp. HN65]|uniref:Uncharacterized protein n=1 Tax=Hyphobacterium lacteum TaxID=3116575 RepID=A0ABU7LP93_9PROT|nr:hypothetical protein [Hyphobacterium sp. HN65]MEE2525720.1 hypothetical protein [Hyphobacterium sp. HN65]
MKTGEKTPEANSTPPARRSGWRLRILAGLAVLIVLSAAIAGLLLYFPSADAPPDDLWAEGSYTADPECDPSTPDCEVLLAPVPAGHGSDGTGPAISLVAYPELDDPIAQWGLCMDTVFTCLGPPDDANATERATRLRACVAQAECPQACLDRYAGQAGGDLDAAVDAFERIFVAEDAWCTPQQD